MALVLGPYNAATNVYGQNETGGSERQPLIPRDKFNFVVKLTHRNPDAMEGFLTVVMDRILSVSMPNASSRVQTLNQYNRKRTVQTGYDYTPISISAYDTRDASIEQFLLKYWRHYFKGPYVKKDESEFLDDLIQQGAFAGGPVSNAGFRLTDFKYFIKNIQIIRKSHVEDISVTTIYNPIITSVDHDGLDYSDSSPMKYSLNFTYEGFDTASGSSQEFQELIIGTPLEATIQTPAPVRS